MAHFCPTLSLQDEKAKTATAAAILPSIVSSFCQMDRRRENIKPVMRPRKAPNANMKHFTHFFCVKSQKCILVKSAQVTYFYLNSGKPPKSPIDFINCFVADML